MTAGSGPLAGRTALSGRAISGRAISGRAVSGSRRSRAGAEIGHAVLAACLAAATAAIPSCTSRASISGTMPKPTSCPAFWRSPG
ncbi:hypothetical protein [Methylobacterium gregans]|uniref:hypothetical protein n=1 Tax=Methylobacterium gregans TaxID=374424 RepID=UPI0036199898